MMEVCTLLSALAEKEMTYSKPKGTAQSIVTVLTVYSNTVLLLLKVSDGQVVKTTASQGHAMYCS